MTAELPPIAPPDHWAYPSFKEQIEAEGVPFCAHVCLDYKNADGEHTIRTVRVTHFMRKGTETYIVGHCELRNEKRAFISSRVSMAYNLEQNSELPSLANWLATKEPPPVPNAATTESLRIHGKQVTCPTCKTSVQAAADAIEFRCHRCGGAFRY